MGEELKKYEAARQGVVPGALSVTSSNSAVAKTNMIFNVTKEGD